MVSVLFKSTLREIRKSLGRYLAILAIIGLGVGFFAGLRMTQPSMMQTGSDYLQDLQMYDYRLLSTLGFSQEDVTALAAQPQVELVCGSTNSELIWPRSATREVVLIAHTLTEGVNLPSLQGGRMPQAPDECIGDANYFTEADLGTVITRAPLEDDADSLFAYDAYTLVGLADSPLYMNFQRGTAKLGSGTLSAFLLIPPEGFDTETYTELYVRMQDTAKPYSAAYQSQIDAQKAQMERALAERADVRYESLQGKVLDGIAEGEQELADGWEEYRTERAKAEKELADALQQLEDGEKEYADGVASYEQGLIDYEQGLLEIADAEQQLRDGREALEKAREEAERELVKAREPLDEGWAEFRKGAEELEIGRNQLAQAKEQLSQAESELEAARPQLEQSTAQLAEARANYQQLATLFDAGEKLVRPYILLGAVDMDDLFAMADRHLVVEKALDLTLKSQGSSFAEFRGLWESASAALGEPLSEKALQKLNATISAGEAELQAGQNAYDQGRAQYLTGLAEYEKGLAELEEAEKLLNDAERELNQGQKEYDQAVADAEAEFAKAEQELQDGERELASARQQLVDAKNELDRAPDELTEARQKLDDGWAEYEDGLQTAEREFADAEQKLRDGEEEIADAYELLAEIKAADTYVLTRRENAGYVSFENDTSIIEAISLVFPLFFFLVAALVCMTTMKRMVDEQRTQIGVLKAIGYSPAQIVGKYLFYAGSAATIGSVIGFTLGGWGLPQILWAIYDIMYGFAPLTLRYDPWLAVASLAAALFCSMGVTYLSCRMELRHCAAQLIRPKAPKAGKRIFLERITPLWKRLRFLHKVSIRNVLRYKSRLIMMLLGIGGCTALLIAGFGLRDSISHIASDQFEQITLFDYAVDFRAPKTVEQTSAFLQENGWDAEEGLLVHAGSTDAVFGAHTKSVYLVIPAENRLDGFISLHDGERPIPFPQPGEVVLNIGLAESLGISTGDRVQLRNESVGTIEVTVSDICDNYIYNYVFVSPQTYEQQLGEIPAYKTLYVLAHADADPYAESVILSEAEGISNVTVNAATLEMIGSTLERLNLVVVLVVAFSAALAFVVLYNLTNININERIREIATIKVLGFHQNETASYVFREILMLSAAASIIGLPLGLALHRFVMAQIQIENMFFPIQITPFSFLISILLTMLFTVLVTLFMRRRLRRIDMAESLKSIE